jgi:DNA (cytosine-5)-methyltransferase 1
MVLRQVQTDLEDQGFQVQCIVIPASGIGAWHQRKRVWIIANSSSQRSSSQSIGEHRELDKEIRGKKETRNQSTLCTSSSCSDVPNTNNNGSYRSQGNATKQSCNKQEDRLSFRDDKQQTWWQTQSKFCGVPNGISFELDKDRSGRIKSLGNSIVPQIARQIGLSIMEAELNG